MNREQAFKPTAANPSVPPSSSEQALPRRGIFTVGRVLALAALVVAALALFLLRPKEAPLAIPPLPVQVAAAKDSAASQLDLALRGDWQIAGEKLHAYRLQLAIELAVAKEKVAGPVAELPAARESHDRARARLTLIERFIVDDAYLTRLDLALAESYPGSAEEVAAAQASLNGLSDEAVGRMAQLEWLDKALAARQLQREELERLREEGVGDWPPQSAAIQGMFVQATISEIDATAALIVAAEADVAAGKFTDAADEFSRAAAVLASLQVDIRPEQDSQEELIAELFTLGKQAISQNRLSAPADSSALFFALEIETLEPGRPEAAELMLGIQRHYIAQANMQLAKGEGNQARRYANMAVAMGAAIAAVDNVYEAVAASAEQQFQPLQPVEEVEGIAMLALPLGTYTMGAKSSSLMEYADSVGDFFVTLLRRDPDRDYSGRETEVPPHPVSIDAWVAISRSEITVGQFRQFVSDSEYLTDAELQGFSYVYYDDREARIAGKNWRHDYLGAEAAADLPVIHVSHRDATAFAAWLSVRTEASYRLPSESEFEYAARAGVLGLTPWGRGTPPSGAGNFRGERDTPPPGWQLAEDEDEVSLVSDYSDGYFGPAPVAKASLNEYGVESLLGNVSEWTADCFHANYEGRDSSQQARVDGDCEQRIVRGTDWSSDARLLRLSYRDKRPLTYSSNTLGFRVARDVNR